MSRGKTITPERRAEIVQAYLSDKAQTYTSVARQFGVSTMTVSRIINEELRAGNGVKPDRRPKPVEPPYMEHITPLHKHRQALEQAVEHKQAELDAAKQELRDFTATLRQLLSEEML